MNLTKTKTLAIPRSAVHRGHLVLVNAATPLVSGEGPALAQISPEVSLEKKTAAQFARTMEAVGGDGQILPVSGYRSKAEQERIYAETAQNSGPEYARAFVALPGCSEHQTGLAIDVAQQAPDIDFVAPDFPYEGICQKFREAAVWQGFIQRYPEGKERITGIGHEPWHFRYVGAPHAGLMTGMGFTLEEYLQWIKAFPRGRMPYEYEAEGQSYRIGYVPAGKGAYTEIEAPTGPYSFSGNNTDGFIIAEREE